MRYDVIGQIVDIFYKIFDKEIRNDVELSKLDRRNLLPHYLKGFLINFCVVDYFMVDDNNIVILLRDVSNNVNYCMKINFKRELELIPLGINKLTIMDNVTLISKLSDSNSYICIKLEDGVMAVGNTKASDTSYYDVYALEYILGEYHKECDSRISSSKEITEVLKTNDISYNEDYFCKFGSYIYENLLLDIYNTRLMYISDERKRYGCSYSEKEVKEIDNLDTLNKRRKKC